MSDARPVECKLFLSWAHEDRLLKEALLAELQDNLAILRGVRFHWWQDSHLHLGDHWRREILERLAGCDYGVLLLTPAFYRSSFITKQELPHFVGAAATRGALPVALKRVPLDGSRNLHGVDAHQIFTDRKGRAFADTPDRAGFAVDLASEIRRRVLRDNRSAERGRW